ncbi:MAG TPA: hypothetical protein VFQ77_15060 [Pseudonocardiaceae bacterium]|jgi:hypothetical protein|nr:hypothetical protein [Pseudonocardiaceae bacterium]
MGIVMQRENERGRVVVAGRRTDDGERCALVVVAEVGQMWAFYPHGAAQLGVRVAAADAVKVAEFLDGAR